MMLRFLVPLLVVFVWTVSAKEVSYGAFIDRQIELTLRLSDPKIDDEAIEEIIAQKEILFSKQLEHILANKERFLRQEDPFSQKIYRLRKIIALNKRRGNTYAVLRDTVLIKSYRILQSQNTMFREILRGLDQKTFDEFSGVVNDAFNKNQKEINAINDTDFKPYLKLRPDAKVIADMQDRIREYYAILEINADILKFIVESRRKMYRLNKYYKYGLIKPVLYINNTALARLSEPFLSKFNLSTVKLLLIVAVVFAMIVLRKILVRVFLFIFENLRFKSRLSKKILQGISRPLDILLIVVGINIVFYVYNDFSRIPFFSALFDMVYVVVSMWSLYKALNVIAAEKISTLTLHPSGVKSELINISIKIVNFTLLLTTLLIMLHLAGVNLTAILSGLGIGGFAIALAAKDSLANFFGTLSILMSDTFSQGDWIVVDETEGVVVEIGLRVTTIRTFDNALISIPNSKLANEAIKNWNRRKIGRRIKFRIALRYDSPREAIEKTIHDVKTFLAAHPGLAKEENAARYVGALASTKLVSQNDAYGIKNMQLVTIDRLGDSSIDLLVYCFSATTDWIEWAKVKDEVILGVMRIVEANGLRFAFPSLSVYPEENAKISL